MGAIKDQLGNRSGGEVIKEISGVTVEEVYKLESGEGKFGPYTRQNFVVSDGETSLRGTAWNMGDLKPLYGQVVTIVGSNDRQGNLKGIKVTVNEYKGEKKKEVALNSYASFQDAKGAFIDLKKATPAPRAKVDYTPEMLHSLYNYWFNAVGDPGAAAKLVGCSMVIGHKIGDTPDAEDLTGHPKGRGKEPSFADNVNDIPF